MRYLIFLAYFGAAQLVSAGDSGESDEGYGEELTPKTGVGWLGCFGYPPQCRGYPIVGSFPSQKPGYGDLYNKNYAIGFYAPYNVGEC